MQVFPAPNLLKLPTASLSPEPNSLKDRLVTGLHWLLLGLAGLLYAYLAFSRPLVQPWGIYGWIYRAATFPHNMGESFWVEPFYPVGYPILLQLNYWLSGDYIVAAKLMSIPGALIGLAAFFHIASRLLPGRLALGTTVLLALHPTWLEFACLETTDMIFSGLALAGVALTLKGADQPENRSTNIWMFAGGVFFGLAYLMRYTGLPVLVFLMGGIGLAWLLQRRFRWAALPAVAAGFLIASALQTIPAWHFTGNPFYNRQYQNVWIGVFAHGDFGAPFQVAMKVESLKAVIMQSPSMFVKNFIKNIRKAFLFSDSSGIIYLNMMALTGIAWGVLNGRDRLKTIQTASPFLGFLGMMCLAFISPRLLLFFLPGALLFAAYFVYRLGTYLAARGGFLAQYPLTHIAGAGVLAIYLWTAVPQVAHPLTEVQAANIGLSEKLRELGFADTAKVLNLSVMLHDTKSPRKALYEHTWYGNHNPPYRSWQHLDSSVRAHGYLAIVTDSGGHANASHVSVPGLWTFWNLDSARTRYREVYSRAGVHGFLIPGGSPESN